MGEAEVVRETGDSPVTVASLAADLRALGVPEGGLVLLHSSLRRLGWVAGGPEAVVEAVLAALGPEGTLVVPAFSTSRTNPANWRNPPVPPDWWPVIRDETPAYDPRTASVRFMGAIAETVLRWPGVRRSAHPHLSFAAVGPLAARVLEPHPYAYPLGEVSPLARLYDLGGHVLLLGVDHGNNTSLHLAEHRATFPGKREVVEGAAVLVDGERAWVEFPDLETDAGDFAEVGAAYEATGRCRVGPAGRGTARLMLQRDVVDFAVRDLSARRANRSAS